MVATQIVLKKNKSIHCKNSHRIVLDINVCKHLQRMQAECFSLKQLPFENSIFRKGTSRSLSMSLATKSIMKRNP